MAHRRPHPWPCSRSRTALIVDADTLFAQSKHDVAEAEVYPPPHWLHRRAARTFEEAKNRYREAGLGLGLKAREAWLRAAECHRKLAAEHAHWAKDCENSRDSVEVQRGGETP